MDPKWARAWFAATAAAVAVGIGIGMALAWTNPTYRLLEGTELPRFGGGALGRTLNTLAYFTYQSNLIVGVTSLLLALNPHRTSTVFRVLRLTGLVAITVTMIVFHVALTDLLELDAWASFSDKLVHLIVPVMAIVGWVSFGPRGLTSTHVAGLTAIFPATYMVFTVVRGPLVSDWYPYPFADVGALGYARVFVNAAWIAVLFVAVAFAATALDRRLGERDAPAPATG